MLYEIVPSEFDPIFGSVGCFVEYNKEIILLHRQNFRPQGNTWGIPSGKIDDGETPLETMAREIKEETGIIVPKPRISLLSEVYFKFPDYDFNYYILHTILDKKRKITIDLKEHKDSKWISPKKALNMPLIEDLDACIDLYYKL